MKILLIISILFLFQGCSFDNKSGIWKSETSISRIDKDAFEQFKRISITEDSLKKEISIENNYIFNLPSSSENDKWNDIFFNQSNNTKILSLTF